MIGAGRARFDLRGCVLQQAPRCRPSRLACSGPWHARSSMGDGANPLPADLHCGRSPAIFPVDSSDCDEYSLL